MLLLSLAVRWENVAQEWAPYLERMTPEQRGEIGKWFRGTRSNSGVPCCSMSDGHPTLEDWRGDTYWIPNPLSLGAIEWMQVPPEAVIRDAGNPIGEAVVWYVIQGSDTVFIRCFVPGVACKCAC